MAGYTLGQCYVAQASRGSEAWWKDNSTEGALEFEHINKWLREVSRLGEDCAFAHYECSSVLRNNFFTFQCHSQVRYLKEEIRTVSSLCLALYVAIPQVFDEKSG